MTVSIGDFSAATSDAKVQDFKLCESTNPHLPQTHTHTPTRATGAAAAIARYDAGRGSTW